MAEATVGSTGRIFISYRREETAYPAGWLFDRLAQHFGAAQIFKDVDSIKLGDDFVQVITRAVGACHVLLALIGDQWLTITNDRGQPRLEDPDDFVRLEIKAALERNVRIIPILVDGAKMPRADDLPAGLDGLERRQALELSPSRFEYDTSRLLKVLDMTLAEVRTARGDAAVISASAMPQTAQNTSEKDVQIAGTAPGKLPGEDSDITQPAAHHFVGNDGSSNGCTLTLVNRDTNETWSNGYPVHDTASFLIPQAGTFRWSAESGCTVVSRAGPGSLTLPAVVDGVGTSDAFEPPATITVTIKDFHGNARCDLELRDVASGTVVDIGELNEQKDSVTLQLQGRPLVYLVNDACGVQVSPG